MSFYLSVYIVLFISLISLRSFACSHQNTIDVDFQVSIDNIKKCVSVMSARGYVYMHANFDCFITRMCVMNVIVVM